jgi:nitrous oxide reductase accessory protein NosL
MLNRRELLAAASAGALALAASGRRSEAMMMKMEPPWVWQKKHGVVSPVRKDPEPTKDEFKKYPRCPYCGMDRKMWSHTRHLIQYDDGTAEGTCSIRCVAVAFAINLDRGPKKIWVGDAGADAKIKPLVEADKATYILDPNKMGTMTHRRKWAYADPAKAKATGAKTVTFDEALQAAYEDLGRDTAMVRKRRAEKRAHMMKKMKEMKGMKMGK